MRIKDLPKSIMRIMRALSFKKSNGYIVGWVWGFGYGFGFDIIYWQICILVPEVLMWKP